MSSKHLNGDYNYAWPTADAIVLSHKVNKHAAKESKTS
jgi:acetyl-CoA carboxylase carboxyltransferase component